MYYGWLHNVASQDWDSQEYILQTLFLYNTEAEEWSEQRGCCLGKEHLKGSKRKGGRDSGCGSGLAPWLGCCLSVHCGLCTFSRHNILQQNRENPAQGMKARLRLRALSALLEDRGSILSSYLAALPSVNPVLGDSVPSSGLQGTRHTNGVQTYL